MLDMNEKFEEWLRKQPGVYPTIREIELARKAWDARGELEKSNVAPNVTDNIEKRCGCVYCRCIMTIISQAKAQT